MTRQRIVFGAVLALAGGSALGACGGSSSETPPPLEPDPRGFHYAPALPSPASESDAGVTPSSNGSADDDDEKPHKKASSTWGAVKTPAAK